jgi:hypothetical protein
MRYTLDPERWWVNLDTDGLQKKEEQDSTQKKENLIDDSSSKDSESEDNL